MMQVQLTPTGPKKAVQKCTTCHQYIIGGGCREGGRNTCHRGFCKRDPNSPCETPEVLHICDLQHFFPGETIVDFSKLGKPFDTTAPVKRNTKTAARIMNQILEATGKPMMSENYLMERAQEYRAARAKLGRPSETSYSQSSGSSSSNMDLGFQAPATQAYLQPMFVRDSLNKELTRICGPEWPLMSPAELLQRMIAGAFQQQLLIRPAQHTHPAAAGMPSAAVMTATPVPSQPAAAMVQPVVQSAPPATATATSTVPAAPAGISQVPATQALPIAGRIIAQPAMQPQQLPPALPAVAPQQDPATPQPQLPQIAPQIASSGLISLASAAAADHAGLQHHQHQHAGLTHSLSPAAYQAPLSTHVLQRARTLSPPPSPPHTPAQ